ncbi:hypothetical protein D030_3540B, partial [Vibrio parahaemolyticus AQ3810]
LCVTLAVGKILFVLRLVNIRHVYNRLLVVCTCCK